ncbi:hypothetical protein ACFL5U_01555 [Candidatus Margulisiibacteriota bacterium]
MKPGGIRFVLPLMIFGSPQTMSASKAIKIISKELESGWGHFLGYLNHQVTDRKMWDHLAVLNNGERPFIHTSVDMRRLHVHEKVEIIARELGLDQTAAHKVALHFEALFVIWLYGGHIAQVEKALPHHTAQKMVLDKAKNRYKIDYAKPHKKGSATVRIFYDGQWVEVDKLLNLKTPEGFLVSDKSAVGIRQHLRRLLETNFESIETLTLELSAWQRDLSDALGEVPIIEVKEYGEEETNIKLAATEYRFPLHFKRRQTGADEIQVEDMRGRQYSIENIANEAQRLKIPDDVKRSALEQLRKLSLDTAEGREQAKRILKDLQAFSSHTLDIHRERTLRRRREEEHFQDQAQQQQLMEKPWPR